MSFAAFTFTQDRAVSSTLWDLVQFPIQITFPRACSGACLHIFSLDLPFEVSSLNDIFLVRRYNRCLMSYEVQQWLFNKRILSLYNLYHIKYRTCDKISRESFPGKFSRKKLGRFLTHLSKHIFIKSFRPTSWQFKTEKSFLNPLKWLNVT